MATSDDELFSQTSQQSSAYADGVSQSRTTEDLKDKDLRIALRIAGYAGLPTRDRHGNVVPDVWTQHGATEEVSTQLLDVSAVRGMLQEQLKAHMEARKELLLDLDDPSVVAKWVIDFSTKWEEEYRNKVKRKWDIAQTILTAMADTMNEVAEVFDATSDGVTMQFMRDRIKRIYTSPSKHELYKAQDDALVRALFRSDYVGPMLARIAGKILQKSLVCNKAGMYSARVQRNDVTRERDDAIEAFVQAHFDNSPIFKNLKQQEWMNNIILGLHCTDHTREEPTP